MEGKTPRRGRPPTKAKAGRKKTLGLRATAEIANRLKRVAERNDRSLSAEAELRLERSFREEDLLPQLLELACGSQGAGVLIALSLVVRVIGDLTSRPSGQFGNWLDDPFSFDEVAKAVTTALNTMRPPGKPVIPTGQISERSPTGELVVKTGPAFVDNFTGEQLAKAVLGNLATIKDGTAAYAGWAATVKRLLGDQVIDRILTNLRGDSQCAER